jgi:hypothetical protein
MVCWTLEPRVTVHRAHFTNFEDVPAGSAMATAARGGTLQITGGGKAGVFDGVMYSHDLHHSVVSVSQLTLHGFHVTFSGTTAEVIHPDGRKIPCVKQPGRAIWWVPLEQIFEIPPPDMQDWAHAAHRTGHTSHNTLREAVRNLLVTGVVLPRSHFSSKAKQSTRASVISAAAPRSPDALFRDNQTASSTCGPIPRYRLT